MSQAKAIIIATVFFLEVFQGGKTAFAQTSQNAMQNESNPSNSIYISPNDLKVQLMEHEKALQDLQLLQNQVSDPELVQLIHQTVPVIQKHIALAHSNFIRISSENSNKTPLFGGTS